jgi:uncharacterized protein (TIGR03437 family)
MFLSGTAGSTDLPAFEGMPTACLPQQFETRISPDFSEVTAARIVPGGVAGYDAFTDTFLVWTGMDLISFDPAAPPSPIACVLDGADLRPVTSIAPGELLAIFGPHFVGGTPAEAPGSFLTSLAGVSVSFNGLAGPLLYVSPQQINVQAPFEIAGSSQVRVALTSSQTNESDSRTLAGVASNPTAFLGGAPVPGCVLPGVVFAGGPLPLIFNADGTRNTCTNPAGRGSVVTIFLAGLGVTSPAQSTGSTNTSPGTPLNLPIKVSNGTPVTVVSATALPGSIAGVWKVDLALPQNANGALAFSLSVGSVAVRDANLTVWSR